MVGARYDRKKAKALGIPVEQVEVANVNWRERIGKTPLLRHTGNGTVYVEFYPMSGSTAYTLDGSPSNRAEVAELVRPPSKGGGVVYRTPKLSSITGAVIGGQKYRVVAG
jgi:hypothetical protein